MRSSVPAGSLSTGWPLSVRSTFSAAPSLIQSRALKSLTDRPRARTPSYRLTPSSESARTESGHSPLVALTTSSASPGCGWRSVVVGGGGVVAGWGAVVTGGGLAPVLVQFSVVPADEGGRDEHEYRGKTDGRNQLLMEGAGHLKSPLTLPATSPVAIASALDVGRAAITVLRAGRYRPGRPAVARVPSPAAETRIDLRAPDENVVFRSPVQPVRPPHRRSSGLAPRPPSRRSLPWPPRSHPRPGGS